MRFLTGRNAAIALFLLGLFGVAWWVAYDSTSGVSMPDRPRVAQVANRLGCSHVEIEVQARLFARESGVCEWNGRFVAIEVFGSSENLDRYVELGSQYGDNYVVGRNWLLMADSPDTAQAAAAKLGGRVL